jgi:hypothetical protein
MPRGSLGWASPGVPRARYDAGTAPREIRILLDDVGYAGRAAESGARERAETGAMTASRVLTGLLERSNA